MRADSAWLQTRRFVLELSVTLAAWAYFLLAFVVAFAPFYAAASLPPRRNHYIQRLNRLYVRGFFALLRRLAPRQRWHIDASIGELRGAVLLCNHLSYLDPLLLIAGLRQSSTVVKAAFFRLPIFGWVLRCAGYLPASSEGRFSALMLRQLDNMPAHLASGGNLFIFPEGTRSRSGTLQPLQPSALKLARHLGAPLHIWRIENTQALFAPGRFLFRASRNNTIRMTPVAVIQPEDPLYQGPLPQLADHLHALFAGEGPASGQKGLAAAGTSSSQPDPLAKASKAQP